MKKILSFLIIAMPMITFCTKSGPLRKAHSAPSLLSIPNVETKQEPMSQLLLMANAEELSIKEAEEPINKPLLIKEAESVLKVSVTIKSSLALMFLLHGKSLRFDSDVNEKANELYILAMQVNPDKRELEEDTNELSIIKKISSKKNIID